MGFAMWVGVRLVAVLTLICVGRVTGLEVIVPDEFVTYELGVINITCDVEGTLADVTYRWTFAGDPDFRVDDPVLYMELVTTDDAGYYTCQAVTVEASPESAFGSTEVIVWYTPRWENRAVQKFASDLGETAMVICKVHAIPTPDFYWQRPLGTNLTNTPDYTIVSDGGISTMEFNSVKTSEYGSYHCVAHNVIGKRSFELELLEPQAPDSPLGCQARNVSSTSALLDCVPGFDGGGDLTFPVYKSTVFTELTLAESKETWVNPEHVSITVEGLCANTSYTLSVYGMNEYGQSEESIGVYVITPHGPDCQTSSSSDFPVVAVACGVAAGVLLVIVLIALLAWLVCRKKGSKKEQTTGFTDTKNTQNYVSEEADTQSTDNFNRRSAKRSSWGSFKRQKRVLKPGTDNPSYSTSNEHIGPTSSAGYSARPVSTPRVASYIDPQGPYTISLNHNPGESHDNPGYRNDSSFETSFTEGVSAAPEVTYRRQMSNPHERARMLSRDQPGLAGSGALQNMSVPGMPHNIAPLTPKLQNDRRISLQARPPSHFTPEVHWEFPREKLYIRKKLGEGSFGEVWRARAEGILGRKGRPVVAVKMLKQRYTPEERRTLMIELEIMKMLQPHPNIIQLLGCCMESDPLSIIMEYASNGNLQDLLRRQRNTFEMNDLSRDASSENRHVLLTARDLMIFALHVASGMDYIESKELLHRDLAARNILVDDQMVCKICDFGSARDVAKMREYESRTQRRLPLRWMAPESLFQSNYSSKSDVWSFGVLFWEVVTLGSSPYPGMSGPEVMEFVQKGCRMEKPSHTTDTVYAIMKDCWNHYPMKRPSFSILRHRLVAILDDPDHDMYVDQMEDNVYAILDHLPDSLVCHDQCLHTLPLCTRCAQQLVRVHDNLTDGWERTV